MTGPKLATTVRRATSELIECVCRARKAAGLSQEAAGRDVGASTPTIARWESGETRPDFAKLLDAPVMGPAFSAELEKLLAARRRAA